MPRKKAEESPTGIINFYEKIPKKFLTQVDNPNFDLHHIKTPCRLVCNAPSGSGKSNFICNLLALFCRGKGTFSRIHLICKNADEPLYNWLKSIDEAFVITEGLHTLPPLDKMDKKVNNLVILDDMQNEKDLSVVENYFIRCRKVNCSIWFLSQNYYRVPKIIRNNCSYLVILKLSGDREVNMILKENGVGLSKDQLINMYKYATAEKFSPLLIDIENSDMNQKYRKGFFEYLNPADYL
jgi:hypothetical protein